MRLDPKSSSGQRAVIYCRVSGAKQVREGDGLHSQETRCREYAAYKGYEVVQVFTDDMTGKASHRPGMQSMLGYLHMQRSGSSQTVVIIDDISRLARGLSAHLELRQSLAQAGGKLESPSIEFGEDSDSILVENLLASVAQHQREKNGEQTANRMRGRMLNGYAVFPAPIGYRYEKRSGEGKILVRDEPVASVIQEVLQGYASGRFGSQAEVKRYLENSPVFPKDLPGGQIRQQKVSDLLNRVIYTGHLEYEPWGVTLRKGKHEALISLETFQRIQQRKTERDIAPMRQDITQDFPLRGIISCACCGGLMTSCWSRSSTGKRYPYYLCQTKGCTFYRKSLRAERIEEDFAKLMRGLSPSKGVMTMMKAMVRDVWDKRTAQADALKAELLKQVRAVDTRIATTLDRIMESNSPTVIAAYEKRIEEMEREKLVLSEKATKNLTPRHSFEDIFELCGLVLSSPWKIWENGSFVLRRTLLRLLFTGPLHYDPQKGFRTPQVSVPFGFFGLKSPECKMVRPNRGAKPARRIIRRITRRPRRSPEPGR